MQDRLSFVRDRAHAKIPFTLPENLSLPTSSLDGTKPNPEYEKVGLGLLRENKVAILMVAGGVSTRMGGGGLRGNIPIGPVTDRTIFRLQGEKIAAIRERYCLGIIWLVMTSRQVHDATLSSFKDEDYFGVPPENIYFFQQDSLPVLNAEKNPVILPDGTYLECPCGHGGMLDAIYSSGILSQLSHAEVLYLYYFQYPNVLENICDPVMLGFHHTNNYDTTTKAIKDYFPEEKMGRCVEVNGNLQIIEYHFGESESLQPWWHVAPASLATHIWSISFLERCIRSNFQLPYHVVLHNEAFYATHSCVKKLEQFIFDLLPHSQKNGLMIVARKSEYAPVKSQKGMYSIDSARQALSSLYYDWLIRAGGIPNGCKGECVVEISPKFALNLEELKSRLSPGFIIRHNSVFS